MLRASLVVIARSPSIGLLLSGARKKITEKDKKTLKELCQFMGLRSDPKILVVMGPGFTTYGYLCMNLVLAVFQTGKTLFKN